MMCEDLIQGERGDKGDVGYCPAGKKNINNVF